MDTRLTINATGIDTETMIQELMKIERQPVTVLQTRQSQVLEKKSAWQAIKSSLTTLSSKIADLTLESTFTKKTASVSDSAVLAVQASSSAQAATYRINVSKLATRETLQSAVFSEGQTGIASGTLVINGKEISVSAADTLDSIAAKINALKDSGVSASVLQVEPGKYRLVLSSLTTGIRGAISLGDPVSDAWRSLGVVDELGGKNYVQQAQDAVFSINGIQFTRSTNEVSDAIPGVTLTLKTSAETGNGNATVTVGYDDQAIIDAVKSFVNAYNSLIDTAGKYNTWDPDTKKAGLLFGDPLLQRLLSELRQFIFKQVNEALPGFQFVGAVGLSTGSSGSFSREGKLTLDETKLKEALGTNRDAVMYLFGAKAFNVASAENGATAWASSEVNSNYPASSTINGEKSSLLWGTPEGGWNDGTPSEFPDTLEVYFEGSHVIDTVNVYTLDSPTYPASVWGLKSFDVYYRNETGWSSAPVATVDNNTSGKVTLSFSPVEADAIRIVSKASNSSDYSRIVEVEAYAKNSGIFSSLKEVVNKYSSADGFVAARTSELESQDKLLSERIELMEKRLDQKYESLKKQFTALEVLITKMNSQSAWLTQQISSLSANR